MGTLLLLLLMLMLLLLSLKRTELLFAQENGLLCLRLGSELRQGSSGHGNGSTQLSPRVSL